MKVHVELPISEPGLEEFIDTLQELSQTEDVRFEHIFEFISKDDGDNTSFI